MSSHTWLSFIWIARLDVNVMDLREPITLSNLSHPISRITSSLYTAQIATYLLISHTSAMTLTIGGLFKDVLLVIFSVIFFGSPLTILQVKRSVPFSA